jgi:hypothetical protein
MTLVERKSRSKQAIDDAAVDRKMEAPPLVYKSVGDEQVLLPANRMDRGPRGDTQRDLWCMLVRSNPPSVFSSKY